MSDLLVSKYYTEKDLCDVITRKYKYEKTFLEALDTFVEVYGEKFLPTKYGRCRSLATHNMLAKKGVKVSLNSFLMMENGLYMYDDRPLKCCAVDIRIQYTPANMWRLANAATKADMRVHIYKERLRLDTAHFYLPEIERVFNVSPRSGL